MKTDKKTIIRLAIGVAVVAALVFGIYEYRLLQRYETTDNAQVEGDIDPVSPKVGGYVRDIRFKDNQRVKKGDTLVVIDDTDYQIRLAQAQAALENAEATVAVMRSNVGVAAANVQSSQDGPQTVQVSIETARANVQAAEARFNKTDRDYQRYERLLAEKTVPQQQFDAVKADRDAAAAQLEAARAQLQTAQSQYRAAGAQSSVTSSQRKASQEQIKVAEAGMKARQADLDFAKLQLAYTRVLAPADGVVSKRNVQVGQLVQPGQSLCAVVTDNEVWVTANFKETQLEKMREGQPVDVEVDAFPGQAVHGRVTSFSGATGARFSLLPPDNATGNYVKVVQRVPVRIELDKNNELLSRIKPGMSVSVSVDLEND